MAGQTRAPRMGAFAHFPRTVLSLFLSLALALSFVPTQAWGNEASEEADAAQEVNAAAQQDAPEAEDDSLESDAIAETEPADDASEASVHEAENADQARDANEADESAFGLPDENPVATPTLDSTAAEAIALSEPAPLAATPGQDEEGVYQLATEEDVLWFFQTAGSSVSAKLCGDFDLSAYPSLSKTSFSGIFDGSGHTLTVALKLASGDKGLFATNSGTIKNLTIAGSVTTTGGYYGSSYKQGVLTGTNTGTIENCTNLASATGSANYFGAMAGSNTGLISGCVNSGSIAISASNLGYAGGMVGYSGSSSKKGTCTDCVNTGSISATNGAGGMVGYAQLSSGYTVLTNCQTTKTLTPTKTQSDIGYWMTGYSNATYTLKLTNCSFYQVPVATLILAGTPETGATLRAQALGANGMEASGTTFAWEMADSAEGPWEALTSATSASTFPIPQDSSLVGKFVRASVTADGGSSADSSIIGPIVKSNTLLVAEAKDALALDTQDITQDNIAEASPLALPADGLNGASITWASSNEAVIAPDGTVTLPETETAVSVILTATLALGDARTTKTFSIKVHPATNPVSSVTFAATSGADISEALVTGTALAAQALGANGKPATNVSYQWEVAKSAAAADTGEWEPISGATKSSYSIPNSYQASAPDAWKGWLVRVVAIGEDGSSARSAASAPITFSDYLCAWTDFQLLQAHYKTTYADIYEPCDLEFPTVGVNGSVITWTRSTDESIIGLDGIVTLPLDKTTAVTVNATVKSGSSSYTLTWQPRVHPVPVALTGVAVEGVGESGQTLTAVPSGANGQTPTNVTYQWEYSANGTTWTKIASYSGGTAATLKYSSSSAKFLRVTATGTDAGGSPVSFTSEAVPFKYLASSKPMVIEIAGTCEAGETLTAQAKYGTYYFYNIDSSQVAWQWLASPTGVEGTFEPIEGATEAVFIPTADLRNSFLQVSARTQGGTYVHTVGVVGPTDLQLNEATLTQAVQLLRDAAANGWTLQPKSPQDTNLTALAQEKLITLAKQQNLDISGITLRLAKAEAIENGDHAALCTDSDNNGAISYFFYNPSAGDEVLEANSASFNVVFELRCGDAVQEWSPSTPVTLGWDIARIQKEILEPAATAAGATMFAEGDSAASVTQDLRLPTSHIDADGSPTAISSPFVTAAWSTSGFDNYYVTDEGVIANRPFADRAISLTGTFTFKAGNTTASLTKAYSFNLREEGWVPGLSDQQILQQKLEDRYQLWNPARTTALTQVGERTLATADDFVLPTSDQLKLGGFGMNDKYGFTATSSNEDVLAINGYRVNVFQPIGSDATAALTVRVYERQRPSVYAEVTYQVTVPALDRRTLEDEIALMNAAKSQFFSGISNGQSGTAVTDNLESFEKVAWGENGTLRWIRTHAEATEIPGGLTWQLVTLGDVPDNNHYFQSSNPNVVTHENMLVTCPDYDARVTITACLSSEKFADYYEQERYRNHPEIGPLLAQLYRQQLETTFTVKGTLGAVDPDAGSKPLANAVTVAVIGAQAAEGDANHYVETPWVALREYSLENASGNCAWDFFQRALSAAGCDYDYQHGFLDSITSPTGETLKTDGYSVDGSWWHFRVNGQDSSVGLGAYFPQAGDKLELVYVPAAGTALAPEISADPNAPVADWEGDWSNFGAAANGGITLAETANSLTGAWTFDYAQGGFASWGEPVIAGGFVFFATGSRLLQLDAATGRVVGEANLAAETAYGCRPVYTAGMVIVPLRNGRLQAVSALTLQTKWITQALDLDQQSLSTLTVADGYLYAFTANADWSSTYNGYAICVNVQNGAVRWQTFQPQAGYYWAGAAMLADHLLVVGDNGILSAIPANSTTGAPAATLNLGCASRSTVVSDGQFAYVVTTDGVLHQIALIPTGALTQVRQLKFADSSTSTPALASEHLFVGGTKSEGGVLADIDLGTWTVSRLITTADGEALMGDVKSHPLVVNDAQGPLVLFTCNGAQGKNGTYTAGGGVYGYRPGNAQATLFFDPPAGLHNYSMASVAFANGRFYYVNDSGRLFCLSASSSALPKPVTPVTPGQATGASTDNNQDAETTPNRPGAMRGNQNRSVLAGGNNAAANDESRSAAPADPTAKSANDEAALPENATPLSAFNAGAAMAANGDNAPGIIAEPGNDASIITPAVALLILALMGIGGAIFLIAGGRKRREGEGEPNAA